MTLFAVVFYGATYGTLAYLSVRELVHWWLRRTHRDRVVVLTELPLGRDARRINQVRHDPSPQPRRRAS